MSSTIYLNTLVYIGAGIWILSLFIGGIVTSWSQAWELAKPAGTVLLVLGVITTVFEKWAWHWPPINPHLVKTPYLTGTYKGVINSQWINPDTKETLPPIETYLSISQTLSTISVRLFTEQSSSDSLVGSFRAAQDGSHELVYTYHNEPELLHRKDNKSPIHYGGARLSVTEKSECLKGNYWTDRKSIGSMEFRRQRRKTCGSFAECQQIAV